MAAIFAMSLVPAGALAQNSNSDSGEYYYDDNYDGTTLAGTNGLGEIKIANSKKGETYDIYRIFDLASFNDSDKTPGKHEDSLHVDANGKYDGEAYSYVIRKHVDAATADSATDDLNKWWEFLTTHGPKGIVTGEASGYSEDNFPYAVTSDVFKALTVNQQKLPYFVIDSEPVTLGVSKSEGTVSQRKDYHVVRLNDQNTGFTNKWDVTDLTNKVYNEATFDYEGVDYVSPKEADTDTTKNSIKTVQDFAQSALAWAQKNGVTPNYVETGTGTDNLVVNGNDSKDGGSDKGSPQVGKVYLGWYLMGTTMGTLASLDTTNKDVTVYEKNQVPELEKKVLKKGVAAGKTGVEDLVGKTLEAFNDEYAGKNGNLSLLTYNSNAKTSASDTEGVDGSSYIDWVDNTDADVNDLVMFRTVIEARQGAKGYKLHDAMEKGLMLLHQTYEAARPYTATPATTINFADLTDAVDDRYGDGVTTEGTAKASYDALSATDRYDIKVYLVREGATGVDDDKKVYEIPSYQSETVSTGGVEATVYRHNWDLSFPSGEGSDGCDFEIAFLDATSDKKPGANPATDTTGYGDADTSVRFVWADGKTVDVKDGDKIVVTYWAKLLPDQAVVYGSESGTPAEGAAKTSVKDNANPAAGLKKDDGTTDDQVCSETDGNNRNTNSTVLVYGQKSHTEWKRAEVTTYQFDIVKTQVGQTSDDKTSYDLLKGAKFRLYKARTGGTARTGDETITNPITFTNGGVTYTQASKALAFERVDSFMTTPSKTVKSYRYVGDKYVSDDANTGVLDDQKTPTADTYTNILTSTYDRELSLHGLEEGWYLLVEEEAPEGFNKLSHPIAIHVNGDLDDNDKLDYDGVVDNDKREGMLNLDVVNNDGSKSSKSDYLGWDVAKLNAPSGTVSADNPYDYPENSVEADNTTDPATTAVRNGGVQVINRTGQELPSTGGIGTTIFYVAGTVLVVGAAVMLVAKRRMGAEA